MSKPMSEDDLFGNLLAEKLKKLPFEINLRAKNEIDYMMFKYSMMSHNNGEQPVQAHQFNIFSNQMSPLPATRQLPHQIARIIQQLTCKQALNLLINE